MRCICLTFFSTTLIGNRKLCSFFGTLQPIIFHVECLVKFPNQTNAYHAHIDQGIPYVENNVHQKTLNCSEPVFNMLRLREVLAH